MNEDKCKDNRHIAKYISQLHRKASIFINREVSKYDIKSGQLMFLLDLYTKDGKNQEEISSRLKIDKGTTARALKKLEDQELITRVKDKEDKRANIIYLTEKSKDLKGDVYKAFDEWNKKNKWKLNKRRRGNVKNITWKSM